MKRRESLHGSQLIAIAMSHRSTHIQARNSTYIATSFSASKTSRTNLSFSVDVSFWESSLELGCSVMREIPKEKAPFRRSGLLFGLLSFASVDQID